PPETLTLFSPGEIPEELSDRLRSVHLFLLQELLKKTSEIRRQIIQRFEQCVKELLCARTVHRELSSPDEKAKCRRRVRVSRAGRQPSQRFRRQDGGRRFLIPSGNGGGALVRC